MSRLALSLLPLFLLAVSATLLPLPAGAQDTSTLSKAETRAAIKRSEMLGEHLYFHDRAAWLATDAVLEDLGDTAASQVGGYVVSRHTEARHPSDLRVAFIDRSDPPQVVWEARERKGKLRSSGQLDAPRDLTDAETARRRAVQTMTQSHALEPCRQFLPMNYAVFADPADPDGQLLGYLLSSTRKPGEVVFGRHFRFTLSLDGASVLDSRGFTNSCIAVPTTTEAGAKLPQGASSVGVTISHLLDPVPQETHVFASLSQGLPVYVIMSPSGTIYEVDGDKINKKAR